MKKSRRTRIVVFSVLAVAGLVAAVLLLPGGTSTFAPGPLSRAHGHLEGEARCADCHVQGAGLDDGLCLACHETLDARIRRGQGFHAKLPEAAQCVDCHSEHLGAQARLIRWPDPDAPWRKVQQGAHRREDFPHLEATGFPLAGAHAQLDCARCHDRTLILDAAVLAFSPERAQADREPTHLGLSGDCAACHLDPHQPALGGDCKKCHDVTAWAPAAGFDHQAARFPLEGAHAKADCAKCHTAPPGPAPSPPTPPVPSFRPLVAEKAPRPFRGVGFGAAPARPVAGDVLPGCDACHANPHRDAQGTAFLRCADCHTPHAFTNQGAVAQGTRFDHATTGFALDGAHARVACGACHGPKLDQAAKKTCGACHEDVHRGAFDRELLLARASCERCHGTTAWKPDTYAEREHPLPLIEGHAVRCETCHAKDAKFPRLPAPERIAIGPLDQSCVACHADVHGGKLGADCASCHGFKSFHLAELSHAGHAELGFPIRDAHAKVSCEGCHGGRAPGGGLRRLALAEARTQGCVACHVDVHRGQLAQDCASCHGEVHFAPSRYDEARHATARLPLQGAHRAVPCEVCHVRDVPPEPHAQRFRWEGATQRCDACHGKDDPHRGQFGQTDCATCHRVEGWRPSGFGRAEHARAGFALDGPHDAACASCHRPGVDPALGPAVTYRGTPKQCAGCHLDPHAGQFADRGGDDGCSRCHLVAPGWKAARFDHDAPPSRFPLTGKHRAVACTACHPTSQRQVADGVVRPVVHYVPIDGKACDSCHQNPHAAPGGRR